MNFLNILNSFSNKGEKIDWKSHSLKLEWILSTFIYES